MSTIVGLGEVLWDLFPDRRRPGGAPANMAYHAHVLGHRGVVASRVGRDALGTELRDLLDRRGVDTDYVQVDNEHDTGTVRVEFVEGEPTYTIVENVAWDYLAVTAALKELAAELDAVCFSTLSQRSPVARTTIRHILDLVKPSIPRVLDVNLRPPFFDADVLGASFRRANVVKMNRAERDVVQELFEVDDVSQWLFDEHDIALICLTKGADGSELITPDEHVAQAAPEADISGGDAVGVGDSFLAVICHHLLEGTSLDAMLTAANRYSAYVVTQRGGMPPVDDDLLDAVT